MAKFGNTGAGTAAEHGSQPPGEAQSPAVRQARDDHPGQHLRSAEARPADTADGAAVCRQDNSAEGLSWQAEGRTGASESPVFPLMCFPYRMLQIHNPHLLLVSYIVLHSEQ